MLSFGISFISVTLSSPSISDLHPLPLPLPHPPLHPSVPLVTPPLPASPPLSLHPSSFSLFLSYSPLIHPSLPLFFSLPLSLHLTFSPIPPSHTLPHLSACLSPPPLPPPPALPPPPPLPLPPPPPLSLSL